MTEDKEKQPVSGKPEGLPPQNPPVDVPSPEKPNGDEDDDVSTETADDSGTPNPPPGKPPR